MGYYGSIKVSDRTGWTRTFLLEKALETIGNASMNDIVLSDDHGSGVAPIHLQVVSTSLQQKSLKIINLMNAAVPCKKASTLESFQILPNRAADLEDNDQIYLGDFLLTLFLTELGISISKRSNHIGLDLELPRQTLQVDSKLIGQICVTNFGDQKQCQFEFELDGLPQDCYQIDPAPLLYPGGKERLAIRFFHRYTQPPAGTCPISLRVFSPAAYPSEEVVISFSLVVDPIYKYSVEIEEPEIEHVADQDQPVPEQPEHPQDGVEPTINREMMGPETVRISAVDNEPSAPADQPTEFPAETGSSAGRPVETPADIARVSQEPGKMPDLSQEERKEPEPIAQPVEEMMDQKPANPGKESSSDSSWGIAAIKPGSGKKSKQSRNLKDVKVFRSIPETLETETDSSDSTPSASSSGDQND
jgi:hypothetical protein